MICPTNEQLQAYFDRELNQTVHAEIDAHVKTCAACHAEIQQLQAMSSLLSKMDSPRLSQISRARLHKNLGATMDRGLIRLAWSLSGIAAAVLVGGLMWMQTSSTPVQAAPPWVDAIASAHPLTSDASSPAAEWFLADSSIRADELP